MDSIKEMVKFICMSKELWTNKGCDRCREDALHGAIGVLKQVASKPFFILYQCSFCGTFWEETPREMHPVAKMDAKAHFPEFDAK